MINLRQRKAIAITAAFAAGGIALAGCAPPGGSVETDTGAGDVSEDLGSEPVHLVLYDGAGLKDVDQELVDAFTAEHPNVTIELRLDPDNVQAEALWVWFRPF